MKQKLEDCCAAADNIRVNGKKELGLMLDHFQEWCAGEIKKKSDKGEGKIVPMTKSEYWGSAKRIFNTHHMVWCNKYVFWNIF